MEEPILNSHNKAEYEPAHAAEHIKDDGTVQDSGYRTIGHVKKEGTVQTCS